MRDLRCAAFPGGALEFTAQAWYNVTKYCKTPRLYTKGCTSV